MSGVQAQAPTTPIGGGGDHETRPPGGRDLAPVALVDLLDRLLGAGVLVAGDVVVSLAGVDLVKVQLHLLISSVRAEMQQQQPGTEPT